jgi:uncharacterized protein YceK
MMVCTIAVTGCGTIANVLGPRENPHVYGGVEFDCLAMQSTWLRTNSDDTKATSAAERVGATILLTGLIAIDFPLSFIGDTITLPGVLFWSGFAGWDQSPAIRE